MKKLILNQVPSDTITIDHLNLEGPHNFYYGVATSTSKGFISRRHFNFGEFRVHAIHAITNGNEWCYTGTSLEALLKVLLNANAQVFVFNTNKELFKWLSE